ncbi:hypothetical protein MNBD_GAMMA11-2653 [hydrothermal vent metagenome]|uniref:PD-(D/E)XK endonuclease-like domain-containing protein n=1 Tax=hydrothermal vent metagenome TaxID=652676 RepID=A0A3B0X988_9ZZZZ
MATTPAARMTQLPIPADQNFTDVLAEHILLEQQNRLPDLTKVHIFLPNAQAIQQMRSSLSKPPSDNSPPAHNGALLGAFVGSLGDWLKQHSLTLTRTENSTPTKKQISQSTRQLLLLGELKQHPELFSAENHWLVCDSLLELFDELSLSQHQWLNEATPVWIEHLQQAYQANEEVKHLNHEAEVVRTLWHAWQQQLNAMQVEDEPGALKQRLLSAFPDNTKAVEKTPDAIKMDAAIPDIFKNAHFYIVGMDQLSPLEQAWCQQLLQFSHVTHISQDTSENSNLQLLQDIYTQDRTFFERTHRYAQNHSHNKSLPTCFLHNIKLYDALSAEQETRAVDLKIRMSLLAGKTNIAVVTENRKLARRLRALLERAQVSIQDTAGWSLATTSAASILERWFECIEQNFAWQPLVDLLKSPFFCKASQRTEHLNLVYRFEQDIILHENIASDLQRYQNAIKNRRERLDKEPGINSRSVAEQLLELLAHIENASIELVQLFNHAQSRPSDIWIKSFIRSIISLGIYPQLSSDTAGVRVQQELKQLSAAHTVINPEINWQDLRAWLGNTLEREQFKPHNQLAGVKIMNLQQAQYCQFDTLIIAGANLQSLPGTPSQHTFFNQSVRQALGFKNWPEKKAYSFYQFQQMLFSSRDILITWQSEENGEWMQPSPWVSSLRDFSQLAFKQTLKDEQLEFLLKKIDPITQHSETLLKEIETVSRAFPCISKELTPTAFSASRHQRLIDCPYKFFASDVLKLRALEEISLELMKSEYGEKVHLILHAFHQQCRGMPAPFKGVLSHENAEQALAHMKALSVQVFETHIEDSVQHRGWLNRWLETAEAYIQWQIQRQGEWQIDQLEQTAEQTLDSGTKLTGRLDRVDRHSNQYSIIDYKTGTPAKQLDIDMAENIQLGSYASLMEDVCNVIYLKLDKGTVKQSGILEGEDLNQLKTDIIQRLESVISDIKSSTALPAWGDTRSCTYCDMSGLCRKQMWEVC